MEHTRYKTHRAPSILYESNFCKETMEPRATFVMAAERFGSSSLRTHIRNWIIERERRRKFALVGSLASLRQWEMRKFSPLCGSEVSLCRGRYRISPLVPLLRAALPGTSAKKFRKSEAMISLLFTRTSTRRGARLFTDDALETCE